VTDDFHILAEWVPSHGRSYRSTLWVAFRAGRLATGEFDGRNWWGFHWEPADYVRRCLHDLDDPDVVWLRPFIERFTRGEDVENEVLLAYAERHGGQSPPVEAW